MALLRKQISQSELVFSQQTGLLEAVQDWIEVRLLRKVTVSGEYYFIPIGEYTLTPLHAAFH